VQSLEERLKFYQINSLKWLVFLESLIAACTLTFATEERSPDKRALVFGHPEWWDLV
jgi:hypothetical protein